MLYLCSSKEKAFSESEGWDRTLESYDAGGDGVKPYYQHAGITIYHGDAQK